MTVARRFDTPLPATGTSRELDALAGTFNDSDSGGRRSRSGDAGGVSRCHSRAGGGARRARSVHRRSFRARERAVGGDRPALELSDHELDTLRLGALLHDIGKIGVPDEVLGKPSALTAAEFELIRAHPVIGARILRSIPFLAAASADRRAAPRAARRPRLSVWPERRRDSARARASFTSPTRTTR